MIKRVAVIACCLLAVAVSGCGGPGSFLVGYQMGRAAGPDDSGDFARCRATGATVEQCCDNHPDSASCQ